MLVKTEKGWRGGGGKKGKGKNSDGTKKVGGARRGWRNKQDRVDVAPPQGLVSGKQRKSGGGKGGVERREDYTKKRVPELRKLLKALATPSTGTKSELVDRLLEDEEA
jgi:hypothetical protein